MKTLIISISIFFYSSILFSQNYTGTSLVIDQDLFIPDSWDLNNDQNYTQGIVLSLHGDLSEKVFILSKPRKFIDKLLNIDSSNFTTFNRGKRLDLFSFNLGGTGFTPFEIGTTEVVEDDRPFSSFLFFNSQRTSIRQTARPNIKSPWKVITSDFTLNIFGLRLGEQLQSYIHEKLLETNPNGRPIPLGWPNQISDGGEPSLLYRVNMTSSLLDFHKARKNNDDQEVKAYNHIFQMTHQVGFGLGYYTYFNTGVNMRLGLIRTKIFLKANGANGIAGIGNKGVSLFKNVIANTPEEKKALKKKKRKAAWKQFELYLFASSNTNLFLYNAALQGQFRHSEHRFSYSEIKPLVFTYDAGIALNIGYLNFGYALTGRTAEFDGQKSRTHTWGSAYLAFQKPLDL